MSSDTAKENASVVDSSATDWKLDTGNRDDQDSSSNKANEEASPTGVEEQLHSCDRVGNSNASKKVKLYRTRYFIIKSLNHDNIQRSIEKGIWATQVMNEPILEEAFHNSGKVILIFSVNMSGFFQGYAQMISSVGWRRDNVWSQGNSGSNPWGRSFKVKWLRLNDLPFQRTLHLKNPLNDYKPVKISRDCQELPQDIGEALCELLDGSLDMDTDLNRVDIPFKGQYIEPPCPLVDDGYNVPPMHMAWASASMLHPSLLYQHQAESSRFNNAHQRTCGVFIPENMPLNSAASKLTKSSPLASTLSDDDFLEMSYEEYLEVHSRSNKQLCQPASGPSRSKQERSRSRDRDETLYSRHHNDRSPSKRGTRHSSHK